MILHGPSQQYLQCHTGNVPQPFKSSPGRKVYFLASTGYAKAAGELLQHRTMPCSPALGVKEGMSKLLMSEDQPLQLCQTCSQELPLFPFLFTSWDTCRDPAVTARSGKCVFFPRTKKATSRDRARQCLREDRKRR